MSPVQKCNREQYVTQESKGQPQALCAPALLPLTCTDILIPGSLYKISGRARLKEGPPHWCGISKNQTQNNSSEWQNNVESAFYCFIWLELS